MPDLGRASRSPSLRTKVTMAVVLAIAVVDVVGYAVAKDVFTEVEVDLHRERTADVAASLAAALDAKLARLTAAVAREAAVVAQSPEAASVERLLLDEFAAVVVLHPDRATTAAGEATANAPLRASLLAMLEEDADAPFTAVRVTRGWFEFAARASVGAPGVAAAMTPEHASEVLAYSAPVLVVAADGRTVAAGGPDAGLDAASWRAERGGVVTDSDGEAYIAERVSLASMDATVVALEPLSPVLAAASGLALRFFVISSAAYAIAGGIVVLVVARSLAPLSRITDGARRLGRGEDELELDVATGDEMQVLAETLNASARAIADARREQARQAEALTAAAEEFEVAVGDVARAVGDAETTAEVARGLADGVLRVSPARAAAVVDACGLVLHAASRDASAAAVDVTDAGAFEWFDASLPESPIPIRLAVLPPEDAPLAAAAARKVRILTSQAAVSFQRAAAAERIRRDEEQHRVFLETLTDGLVVARGDGFVAYANPAAAALGVRVGEPLVEAFARECAVRVHAGVAAPPRAPEPPALVDLALRDEAGARVAEVRVRAVRFAGAHAALVLLRDVTERARTEARLLEQQRIIVQTEKLAAVGSLTAGVAHEVNNPLMFIIGNEELAVMDLEPLASDPRLPEDARLALAEAVAGLKTNLGGLDHIKRIVRSLRELSRESSAREPVDLSATTRNAVLLAGDRARKGGVALELDVPELPPVLAAPQEIGQVLLNLLLNAVEATPPGGRVRLTARAEDGALEFRVADTGAGIPPKVRARLFNPFFTTKADGVGLGLSIGQRIVQDHGGTISYSTEEGRGTEFVVRLPLPRAATGTELAP